MTRLPRFPALPLLLAVLLLSVAPACRLLPGRGGAEEQGLTVFAAASLREAFQELGAAYQAEHPGTSVTFAFDGSDRLRLQLEQGARADVFASADAAQMAQARAAGLLDGEPQVFARNRLALVVPRANPGGVHAAADLARPGVRVVLAAPAVPAGAYARELLRLLEADLGREYARRVEANVISQEQNVRAVLTKVELGEADAGIVYATDVTDGVAEVPVPGVERVRVEYPAAVLRGSGRAAEARAFVAFLRSAAGQAILARHGFLPVE
ncbi:MAG TPA: molybdate ABC transporter substrate-binding protein [Dehalococcoidia bacterium]